jgi:hypothetical protein
MSDFLSNLFDRHQGTAELVKPRPYSLFEPNTPEVATTPPENTMDLRGYDIDEKTDLYRRIEKTTDGLPETTARDTSPVIKEQQQGVLKNPMPAPSDAHIGILHAETEQAEYPIPALIRPHAETAKNGSLRDLDLSEQQAIFSEKKVDASPVGRSETAPTGQNPMPETAILSTKLTDFQIPRQIEGIDQIGDKIFWNGGNHRTEVSTNLYVTEQDLNGRIRESLDRIVQQKDRTSVIENPFESPQQQKTPNIQEIQKPQVENRSEAIGDTETIRQDTLLPPIKPPITPPAADSREKISDREERRIKDKQKLPETQESLALGKPHELLIPPAWLMEVQSRFGERWQSQKSKMETEPVINVTIGRVEVRATQARTESKPKRQKKPTGVMSLDDYLKQREHRERG